MDPDRSVENVALIGPPGEGAIPGAIRRLAAARRRIRVPACVVWLIRLPLWRDNLFCALLAIAIMSNAAVFAFVNSKYTSLPPFLPLHYSASGEVDRLGTPVEVFMMPAIGAVVLIANIVLAVLACRRERLAVHIITGTTIFVEILLLIATANIISRA